MTRKKLTAPAKRKPARIARKPDIGDRMLKARDIIIAARDAVSALPGCYKVNRLLWFAWAALGAAYVNRKAKP